MMAVNGSGGMVGVDAHALSPHDSTVNNETSTPAPTSAAATSFVRRRRRRNVAPLSLLLTAFTLLHTCALLPIVHAINDTIPPQSDVMENLMLSSLLYRIHGCNDTETIPEAKNLTCHHYEQKHDGTQVAVLSNPQKNYVAVSYAGTDNAYDVILDVDVKMVPFGPKGEPLNADPKIRVHGGFNEAVFGDGLYHRILDQVRNVLHTNPTYRLLVTGHSLGAADSVLTAVAFATQPDAFPERRIDVINFGCPRTSNHYFRQWANSLQNLSLWRFVHRNDIVPRIPFPVWKHVGHTVQLYKHRAAAYYLHEGDVTLGYAGVPMSWQSGPWATLPTAGYHHVLSSYENYLLTKSFVDPARYYVDGFVTLGSMEEEELELESLLDEEDDEEVEWDDDVVAVVAERMPQLDGKNEHDDYDKAWDMPHHAAAVAE